MPKCTRQGCQKEFEEDNNEEGACMYHSGRPVFHEGLKSWSCCEDVNRPVLDFDSFMLIPGCTPGKHTAATNLPVPKPVQTSGGPGSNLSSTPAPRSVHTNTDGQEVFSSGGISSMSTIRRATSSTPVQPIPPPPEEEDDTSVPVQPGTKCLRNGCKHLFVSEEASRGEGEESKCVYHPRQPLFHEGSKGYLCCKRRVLEFDEFLRIDGCKTGKHLFVKKRQGTQGETAQEESVTCRIDHYQTPTQVLASVYAKKVDSERSNITFEDERVHLDLFMPPLDASKNGPWKRFRKTVELFGRVKGGECKYVIRGTKVDLTLVKEDVRSWTLLEKTDADLAGITLTFGVGGRTGTVGGKELVLDDDNKAKQ